MNNPLGGENSLSEALCKIEGASRGAGATPLEAVALARKEIIKAKVALEDMHGQWKRTAPKLAAAVFLWTALHLKQYEHGGLKGETVEQLLRGGDALLWAHMVSLLLTLYLMASHWMAKRKRQTARPQSTWWLPPITACGQRQTARAPPHSPARRPHPALRLQSPQSRGVN